MGIRLVHGTAVAALVAACSSATAPPPFTVMIGDRAFTGAAAVFLPIACDHGFAVVLSESGKDCNATPGGPPGRERILVELDAKGLSGLEVPPGLGEYTVNWANERKTARVYRQPAGSTNGVPDAVDESVSGSVFVDAIGPKIVRLRLDVVLASGAAVTGTIDAGTCRAAFASLSGEMTPPPGLPQKELRITKLYPHAIFVEGGEVLTLETENGCAVRAITVKIGATRIAEVSSHEPDRYTFVAPSSPDPTHAATVSVTVTCSEPPSRCSVYSRDYAEAPLTFNPALEPQPVVTKFEPESALEDAPIALDSSMKVTFSRAIDPTTVTAATFQIDGVTGHHTFTDGDDLTGYKTVAFTPDAPLEPDRDYTCVVTNGVKSKLKGKPLKPGVTPLAKADHDAWTFHTVCDGCATP